tara:strand:- start:112 stop:768 length:657 start_codon:yes stop_codon:yes gene_type:complete
MKAFVIAIQELQSSIRSANKCIMSASEYDVEVELFDAITPNNDPYKMLIDKGISEKNFEEVWSRTDRCISAFLSHHTLWERCAEDNEPFLIFEHDAIVEGNIPTDILDYENKAMLISFGSPSYGKFNTPPKFGLNKLISKQYLPGAHSYMINPKAAKIMIEQAKTDAGPTDVYLNNNRFDFLHEYYPYPVVVKDTFTTIQRKEGCMAKHAYNERYEII